jgi:CheY-like chemotaxis protein
MQAYSQLFQRGGDIKLLVTDLGMPELDGSALARIVRHQFPEIHILVISGRDSAINLSSEHRDQSNGFLLKPFKPYALLKAVDRLFHPKQAA